jgi:perosamine synthetase
MSCVPSLDSPPSVAGKPIAPITPIFECRPFHSRADLQLPMLLDAPEAVLTTSGRAALALAFRQLEIGPGDEVLVPAYHCVAMTGPVRALGATPVSYPTRRDFTIETADVVTRIGQRTRCLVVVHFFGFPTALDEIRQICDRSGVALIEDCAHAFYGPRGAVPIGRAGDFAIGSLMKFFPSYDGGCLVSFRRKLSPPALRRGGFLFQLKAAVAPIERWAAWSPATGARFTTAVLNGLRSIAKRLSPGLGERLATNAPSAASGGLEFESNWVDARISTASRLVIRHADHVRNVERRRAAYARLSSGLGRLVGGEPLRRDLPDGVVPYVFPFILSKPELAFSALRRAGVPMYRWEDVDDQTCETARYFKARLVQFPCHQNLTEEQLDRLVTTIERASSLSR